MIARSVGRLATLPAVLLLTVLALAGCTDATAPSGPTSAGPTDARPTDGPGPATPRPTTDVNALFEEDWRRIAVDPQFHPAVPVVEAACRDAAPEIGPLPVVLIDARGLSRLLFVFATGPTSAAWECRASLDAQTAADVDVIALQDSGDPIGDEGIDSRHYEAVELGEGRGIVAVGRAGRLVDEAIGQFDSDETFIYATVNGGWWAMWWPGSEPVNGIGATDTHNAVIGETRPPFPLIP
jgi:hypothetical protein